MRIERLVLAAYGRCRDVGIDIGDGVTVVLGVNEAGKSTSLDALSDLLWGIPRSTPRTSEFPRAQLRIDATVAVDGASCTLVRKSTGLFAEDLATTMPPPWDPQNRLTVQWWRTRLGINHADLRRGGSEVFAGSGDIADIIFAAREGRGAREVLKEIGDRADKLFKPDGRAKKVELRRAMEEYQRAIVDRDSRLTRAGEVVAQREIVDDLAARHRHRRDDVTATTQELKLQEENRRVIAGALRLRQAVSERETIDGEGDRLSADELAEYDRARAELRGAAERITKLENDIDAVNRDIDGLSVDDRLLDDRATLNRLQPNAMARIEDLRRAGEEFGPAVAEAETQLLQQLRSIGIDTVDDLDDTVAGARVRDDHAATLNDLADRLNELEGRRQEARDERDRAIAELLAKGVGVEPGASEAPDEEALGALRKALNDTRTAEGTAERLLTEATEDVAARRSAAADPHAGVALSHADVVAARKSRDAQWGAIKRSWLTDEQVAPAERVGIADDFGSALRDADRLADDEAAERSRVAALDARTDAHDEGLDAALNKQRSAAESLEGAVEERRRCDAEWAAAWAALGIATPPDTDNGPAVAALLTVVHIQQARERSAAEQITEIQRQFDAAAEPVGLPTAMTPAAWHRRAEILEDIAGLQDQRLKDRAREKQARGRWEEFVAEAVALFQRHGAIDPDQPTTPAMVEQAFTKLGGRLDAATIAETRRETYGEQIDAMRTERAKVQRAQETAADAVRRLTDAHSVDGEQELDGLAERARRAAEPLEQEAESTKAIKNGLSPGSDFAAVVERLTEHDETTVERAVEEAQRCDQEARGAAERALSDYTAAHGRLTELEEAAGAAEAEAAVVAAQAEVARLTESWAVLALQRKLLEDVLERLGSSDTRPLLDHAGRLLEELTGGRWVALRAEDDGVSRKLRVIRADNTPCDPSQLSEGTADQVFFALRLAAVAELHNERVAAGGPALPLVLDDVLMAFDEARVRSALKSLVSLAPGLQVIVFTHHQHVAEAAAELGEIAVSRLPAAATITDPLAGELIRAQAQQSAAVTP